MNIENFSLIVTSIVGVTAVISPVFVALINNHYQFKLKKLELYTTAKNKAISDYLESCSIYAHTGSAHNYYISHGKVLMYVPFKTTQIFEDDPTYAGFEKLISSLSKYLAK